MHEGRESETERIAAVSRPTLLLMRQARRACARACMCAVTAVCLTTAAALSLALVHMHSDAHLRTQWLLVCWHTVLFGFLSQKILTVIFFKCVFS